MESTRPARGRRTRRPVVAAELSDQPLPPLDPSRPPWPGRRLSIEGASIYVRSTPSTSSDPQPALYVHGLGGSATNWTDLAAQLSGQLAGEALDLPGFGRSGPSSDGRYTLQSHARVVISYLESSGRGPVHLFGNSMGGAISILVAAQRRDLVRTLTLISPAVPDRLPNPRVTDPRMALVAVPGLGELIVRRLDRYPVETRVQGTLDLCFADPSRVTEARRREAIDEARARAGMRWTDVAMIDSLRSIAASYARIGRKSMWAQMAAITAPTLVVWGDRDRLVNARMAPIVAGAIPNSRLLVLPGVGHVAQMEDPVSTARGVLGLLSDSDSDSDGQASAPGRGAPSAVAR